ncbi:MAG TPA: ASCH domain-containing protein [Nitrosopumilaceae archaeon]|nr:ASCH domain-containing protein [Nitrosopumilaceae archaeon]
MKCLSVSQPFADLIVSGKKTIELRKWNTSFRGEFLVHSPLKIRINDCKRLKISKKLVVGAIIGKAEIIDVKKYNSRLEVKADSKRHLASPDFFDRKYGFVLKNPKTFRIPIPCKGKLGFFDVEIPKNKIRKNELTLDIIDEEQRYRLVGHH